LRKLTIILALVLLFLVCTPSALSQEQPATAPPAATATTPAQAATPATPAMPADKPAAAPVAAQPAEAAPAKPDRPVPVFKAGAKVFMDAMDNDFGPPMKQAIADKKVPITLVDKKEDADFLLRAASDTQKASTAKKVIMWNWHSNEQASISVVNVVSGEVVFAYNVNKPSSAHGKRSTAEACAKHIKEKLEEAK